ncbi:hypothetical protein PRUB_b0708 [Pseudoalteromonas rubra]|uniref:Uncharacterized protein n=1 Tax=Pseudoalteromonas rubra TaxID=43658 RepID=A0A8T0C2B4_9GAMM|nr:hypothetical protein PRUB_b0708 [Pseudoalteromonas rubra]
MSHQKLVQVNDKSTKPDITSALQVMVLQSVVSVWKIF